MEYLHEIFKEFLFSELRTSGTLFSYHQLQIMIISNRVELNITAQIDNYSQLISTISGKINQKMPDGN